MISRRRLVFSTSAGVASHALSARVFAQAPFPARPVHLVVPFAVGGPLDYIARLIASRMALEPAAQPWVVENVVGASGRLATRSVARAPRDGYRLLMADLGSLVTQSILGGSDEVQPLTDLTPVAGVGSVPFILVARRGLPVASLADVVEAARRTKAGLTFGSSGPTSVSALLMQALGRHFNIELVHVPFAGNSPVVLELAAERIDLAFLIANILGTHGFHHIAITSEHEVAQWPRVAPLPPLLGQRSDFRMVNALLAPRDTPADAVNALASLARRALTAPQVIDDLARRGFEVDYQPPAGLNRTLSLLNAAWSAILRKI